MNTHSVPTLMRPRARCKPYRTGRSDFQPDMIADIPKMSGSEAALRKNVTCIGEYAAESCFKLASISEKQPTASTMAPMPFKCCECMRGGSVAHVCDADRSCWL